MRWLSARRFALISFCALSAASRRKSCAEIAPAAQRPGSNRRLCCARTFDKPEHDDARRIVCRGANCFRDRESRSVRSKMENEPTAKWVTWFLGVLDESARD